MGSQSFSTGTEFVWKGIRYFVKRLLQNDLIEIEGKVDGQPKVESFQSLYNELVHGRLQFQGVGDQPAIAKLVSLDDYSKENQEIARFRLQVIEPLLKIPSHLRKNQDIVDRVIEVQQGQELGTFPQGPVSRSSIYRWLRNYTKNGEDIRKLVPGSLSSSPTKFRRLNQNVEEIIQQVIDDNLFVREQVTVDDIFYKVYLAIEKENLLRAADRKLQCPGKTTVWRRIDAQEAEKILTAQMGKRAAKAELTQYGRMQPPRFPLERVEIDHTITDLIVVDDEDNLPIGRLTLTICIDVATRYPLGYYIGFEPPSYLTVAACLYHAMLPKSDYRELFGTENEWLACGVPHKLIVDNGKEFIGASLQDSCLSLGIILEQMPPYTPHYKGVVERNFRTINTNFFHKISGTTFSHFKMKGDYNSLENAVVRRSELEKLLVTYLIDDYAQSFHRGIKDTPAHAWEKTKEKGFFARVPTNPEELPRMLGRVDERAVFPYGIDLKTIRYNDESLALLRYKLNNQNSPGTSKKVKVKYIPSDLGSIYVYDPFAGEYIEVPALDQDYAKGLSLWEHQLYRHYEKKKQQKRSPKNSAETRQKFEIAIQQEKEKGKKLRTRTKIGRFQERKKGQLSPPPESSMPKWLETFEVKKHKNSDEVNEFDPESSGWRIEYFDSPS